MDNSNFHQQVLLLIKDKLLREEIKVAVSELQNLIKHLESINDITKNIQRLGYILIIAGIKDKYIRHILRSSSEIILREKGIDHLFEYWIELQKQDIELCRYIIDISINELSNYAERIDIKSTFNENITWFLKYNKTFLTDLFEGMDYSLKKLNLTIKSIFRTSNSLYYEMDRKWHAINTKASVPDGNTNIPLIYYIETPAHLAEIIHQHNSRVMVNDTIKFDRYIIIDSHMISILMQVLPFSQLENGNYWFHFLLDAQWKKRLIKFAESGYVLPNKGIANKDRLQNLLIFINELNCYFDDHLAQESLAELKNRYSQQYLNNLRKKYQKNYSGLRILLITSRHSSYIQYASETLNKGFRKIGCKSILLREKKHQGVGFKLEFVLRLIKKFKPDLIVTINNFRPEWARQFLPEIPYATWVHDPPETLPRPCHTITDNDFIFAAVKSHIDKELPEAFPVLKNYAIPLVPFVKDIKPDYPIRKNKRYDIGCITNIGVLPEVLSYYEPEKCIGSNMEKLIHLLLSQMEALEPFEIASILRSRENSLSMVKKGLETLSIHTSDTIDEKHPLVTDTLQFGIGQFLQKTLSVRYLIEKGYKNIFIGGFGWDQLDFFKPYAAGLIPHKDLPHVVSNIAININPTAELTFHPRIGEMLEANSFVISSWKGDADALSITDYFIEDEEVVLFKTYKDLVKKVDYFLKHPEKRESITQRAKEKFIQNFSAEMGCRKILNRILEIK